MISSRSGVLCCEVKLKKTKTISPAGLKQNTNNDTMMIIVGIHEDILKPEISLAYVGCVIKYRRLWLMK